MASWMYAAAMMIRDLVAQGLVDDQHVLPPRLVTAARTPRLATGFVASGLSLDYCRSFTAWPACPGRSWNCSRPSTAARDDRARRTNLTQSGCSAIRW